MHEALGSIRIIHTVPLHRETRFRAGSGPISLAYLPLGHWPTNKHYFDCLSSWEAAKTGTPDHPRQYPQERACGYHCLSKTPHLFFLTQAQKSELGWVLGRKGSALSHSALLRTSRLLLLLGLLRSAGSEGSFSSFLCCFLSVPIPGHRQPTNGPSALGLNAPAFEKVGS